MKPETLHSPIDTDDPWQAALDNVFEEKFSLGALAQQAEDVVSLREEAVNFLSIAENLAGFETMQQYAMNMCLNHPHLEDTVQSFMGEYESANHHDHSLAEKAGKNVKNDKSDKAEKDKKKKDKKKKFLDWFQFKKK